MIPEDQGGRGWEYQIVNISLITPIISSSNFIHFSSIGAKKMPLYPTKILRCQHIKVNGTQCGSPSLREANFCYYHIRYHWTELKALENNHEWLQSLPTLEDANSIQVALAHVIERLIMLEIDHKQAALILYALQTASMNLKRTSLEPKLPTQVVIDRQSVARRPIGASAWSCVEGRDYDDLTKDDPTNDHLTNHDLTNNDLTNNDVTNHDLTNNDVTSNDLTKADVTRDDLASANGSEILGSIQAHESLQKFLPVPASDARPSRRALKALRSLPVCGKPTIRAGLRKDTTSRGCGKTPLPPLSGRARVPLVPQLRRNE